MVSFSLPYFLPYSDIAYMFNCLFVSMLFRVSFLVRTLTDGNCSRATSVKTVGVCGSISWPLLSPIESVGVSSLSRLTGNYRPPSQMFVNLFANSLFLVPYHATGFGWDIPMRD
jgi:hypothetical protein